MNVWLSFFGADAVAEEWTVCPFCSGNVRNYVCFNDACKIRSYRAFKCMLELDKLLALAEAGQKVQYPDFWDSIKDGSEFDIAFKKPIERIIGGDGDVFSGKSKPKQKNGYENASDLISRVFGIGKGVSDTVTTGTKEASVTETDKYAGWGDISGETDGLLPTDESESAERLAPADDIEASDIYEPVYRSVQESDRDVSNVAPVDTSETDTAVKEALGAVNLYFMQIRMETMKDSPDFDDIMDRFKTDLVISNGMATGDSEVNARVNELLDALIRHKDEQVKAKERQESEKREKERLRVGYVQDTETIKEGIIGIRALIGDFSVPLYEIEEKFFEINLLADKIAEVIESQTEDLPREAEAVVNGYNSNIRPEIQSVISVLKFETDEFESRFESLSKAAEVAYSTVDVSYNEYAKVLYQSFSSDNDAGADLLGQVREDYINALIDRYSCCVQRDNAQENSVHKCNTCKMKAVEVIDKYIGVDE